VILTVICSLWLAHSNPPDEPLQEIGVSIPSGQLIVPLELANAQALSGLITRNAIIDVFKSGETEPLVESLRVLKLSSGEGPLFGALVPENLAGSLQDVFSSSKLRGAIKTNMSGATQFHLRNKFKPSLLEIPIGD